MTGGVLAHAVPVAIPQVELVEQLRGARRIRQPHLRPLCEEARDLLKQFEEVDLAHVPREQNADADSLVNAALDAR